MLQPLAIVFYERLMPGSQLVNRLQDLNYRVLALNNAARLVATVQREPAPDPAQETWCALSTPHLDDLFAAR